MLLTSGSEVPLVAGIDFGTTQSLVAAKTKDGIELLSDPFSGQMALPSVVWVGDESFLVGDRALQQSLKEASNSFSSIKRLLGRNHDELEKLIKDLPYDIEVSEEGIPELQSKQGGIHPVELVEEILRSLKTRVELKFRRPLFGAVLTVPAYFDEVQRKCIKDAAHLAEIRVLRLLNEPTAAALAYLSENSVNLSDRPIKIAVYDFGGGTFDISILQIYKSFIEVLATGGDTLLGGDDIDSALSKVLQNQWEDTYPDILLGDYEQKRQKQQFLRLASKLKIGLSLKDSVEAQYGRWKFVLHREVFDEITKPIIKKSLDIVEDTLIRADISKSSIDNILLVGGPTRLPIIRQMVREYFDKKPNVELDPEGAVAMGAAIHAENLINSEQYEGDNDIKKTNKKNRDTNNSTLTLLDVTPLSFGLETLNDRVEIIIPRNTPTPASCTHRFTNASNNQIQIPFHIVQGESPFASKCRSLARFVLTNLPPRLAGELDILVQFSVDSNGLLTVSVEESNSGISHTLVTQPTYRIPSELMEELEEAEEELFEAPVSKSNELDSKQHLFEEIEGFLSYLSYRENEHERKSFENLWTPEIHNDIAKLKELIVDQSKIKDVKLIYKRLKDSLKTFLFYINETK